MFCFYCAAPIEPSETDGDWFECANGHRYAAEFIAVLDNLAQPAAGIPEIVMEAYGTVGPPP